MMCPSLPKRWLVCLFFLLLPPIEPVRGAADDLSLFVSYEGSIPLPSVNPAVVSRQRLVNIRLDSLPMSEGGSVVLNLFEGTALRAVCESVELNLSGGFVWNGRIDGVTGGIVCLHVVADDVAGSVETPDFTYHIRSVQDGVHVIREIEPPAYRSPLAADGTATSDESEVVRLVNLERQVANLPPLAWDNALGAAAWGHSDDMAQQNYFNHTSLDGRQFNERITAAGYSYSTCGENIAAGYSTPQAVMNGWMNSSGHRANILSASFCDIGVGYAFASGSAYSYYWTQDFGRRAGVSACATNGDSGAGTGGAQTDTGTASGGGGGGGGGGGCFIRTIAR